MQKFKTLALGLSVVVMLAGCTAIPGLNSLTNSTANSNTPNTPYPTGSGQNTSETQNGDKAAGWPSDAPTPDGAYSFTYAKYIKTYTLTYDLKLSGKTLLQVHNDEVALLEAAGWTLSANTSLETDSVDTQQLTKDTRTISVTTTQAASSDDFVNVSFYISDTTSGV